MFILQILADFRKTVGQIEYRLGYLMVDGTEK